MHKKPHAAPSCCLCSRHAPLIELGIVLLHGEIPLLWGCHYNLRPSRSNHGHLVPLRPAQPRSSKAQGVQRAGWTQPWMCVNVSGFVPVKREPEQCLCIAVPTELGPSRHPVSSSRASSDPRSPDDSQLHPREEVLVGKEDPGNLAEEVEGGSFPYAERERDGTLGFHNPQTFSTTPFSHFRPPVQAELADTDMRRLTPHPVHWFPKANSNRKLQ